MKTISVRFSEDDMNLIREYAAANGLNTSTLIRDSVPDTIEDSMRLDEERILAAWEQSKEERRYSHEEMLRELNHDS